MQLHAYNKDRLISAIEAVKKHNYTCPECGHHLRLRHGRRRRAHFYHISRKSRCRQSGKSATHLAIQEHILHELPEGQAFLEHPFKEISRIADVAWPEKKIVFEVQCSDISLEEAKQRTEDYASIGYLAVWILHTKKYGNYYMSTAEKYLRNLPAYYTAMDETGAGFIYDIYPGSNPFPVDLTTPLLTIRFPDNWPSYLARRGTTFFRGDVVDYVLSVAEVRDKIPDPENEEYTIKHLYLYWLDYCLRKFAVEEYS